MFIYLRVLDFLASGIATNFSIEHSGEDGAEMPQLTICAVNSYDDTDFFAMFIEDRNQLTEEFLLLQQELG